MRVAMCQISVSDDPEQNLSRIRVALATASAAPGGADLAVFPEAAQIRFGNDLAARAEPLDGPFVTALRAMAREHGMALIAGVFEPSGDGRVFNTAVAIEASGDIAGAYRKIHLFDAFGDLESDRVASGDTPVVVTLAGTRIGLLTCYDVRFPELARALMDRGAELLVIIAAWAQGTFKEEHWTTLVRARAIENTVWTAAVDQAPEPGTRPARGPAGVGRSLLVDPMGVVRADLGPFPDVHVLEIDQAVTDRIRRILPVLSHRRPDVR